MQKTKFRNFVDFMLRAIDPIISNSWRKRSLLLFSLLFGFYFTNSFLSFLLDKSVNTIFLAIIILLITELIIRSSEIYKYSKPSLGPVSEFVRDLSKNVPFLYGMASLVLALGLGVGAAVLRKVLSKLKDKYIPKPTISTK